MNFSKLQCISAYYCTELPSLLPVVRVSEALLRLEKGPHLLCRLVANIPDCFDRGMLQQGCIVYTAPVCSLEAVHSYLYDLSYLTPAGG